MAECRPCRESRERMIAAIKDGSPAAIISEAVSAISIIAGKAKTATVRLKKRNKE